MTAEFSKVSTYDVEDVLHFTEALACAAETGECPTMPPDVDPLAPPVLENSVMNGEHTKMMDQDEQAMDMETFQEEDATPPPTHPQQSSPGIPISTFFSLCFCTMTYSYLVISVFPYAAYMVVNLVDSANQDTAGSYAGLLASCFHFGIFLTAVKWGQAADLYGRVVVLKASLSLSAFISVLFGFAPTYGFALAVRFCLGMSSTIISTVKTLVSDLAQGNEREQARVMSSVLGTWGVGFLIGPLISGQLAEPVKQYQHWGYWETHPKTAELLERFPFLIPNLVGLCFCILALFLVHNFIPETIEGGRGGLAVFCRDVFDHLRRCGCLCGKQHYESVSPDNNENGSSDRDASRDASGIANGDADPTRGVQRMSMKQLFSRRQTRSCLFVIWGGSFVSLASAEMLPLFFISPSAGFGFVESKIGQILSTSGLLFVLLQLLGLPTFLYNRFGLHGCIRVGATLLPVTFWLIPISLLLDHDSKEGGISPISFCYLVLVLAINKTLFLVFFSNSSVTINRTAPMESRASLNGLSVVGSSVARGLGPTFSGLTATFSVAWLGRYGSLLMLGSLSFIASLVAISTFIFMKEEAPSEREESMVEMVEGEASESDERSMT